MKQCFHILLGIFIAFSELLSSPAAYRNGPAPSEFDVHTDERHCVALPEQSVSLNVQQGEPPGGTEPQEPQLACPRTIRNNYQPNNNKAELRIQEATLFFPNKYKQSVIFTQMLP